MGETQKPESMGGGGSRLSVPHREVGLQRRQWALSGFVTLGSESPAPALATLEDGGWWVGGQCA